MDRGAWQDVVHRVTKNQKSLKQLSIQPARIIELGEKKMSESLLTLWSPLIKPGFLPPDFIT